MDLKHSRPDYRPLVMIFDGYADAAEMVALELGAAGFRTIDGHVSDVKRGVTDFVEFIRQHDPNVVIWDISPPYDGNWNFFQLIRSSKALDGCGMVITTTHKGHLDKLIGSDSGAIEIIGKPHDLGQLVDQIRRALGHPL